MSDIKEDTWLSVLFEQVSAALYAAALYEHKERLKDTEAGSEERFHEAMDITKNFRFVGRILCRLASLLTRFSFFFMKDVTI